MQTTIRPDPSSQRFDWSLHPLRSRLAREISRAVVLIVVAYAYPIWQHLQMQRFGSPGFSPF
jgi:hypothetical protein